MIKSDYMTPHFEFLTISELLEYNCNFNRKQKEFILDELTQYDEKNGKSIYLSPEGIIYDIIEHLEEYASSYRNKHGIKKNCKCQECVISEELVGLENVLLEYAKQIEELQTKLLNYSGTTPGNGMTTIGNEIGEGITEKSSIGDSAGPIGIVGGAIGGAGGGFGVETKNIEKLVGSESKTEATKFGPGTIGGAAGGALGSSGLGSS